MTNSLLRCRIIAALLAMLCGTAHATITLSTTTRAGTSATGTGTAISGRAPLPVVIDSGSGTTTTHSTGSAEQIGIRFAEKKLTTCSYTHGTLTLTCTDAFTTLSWELNTASTNGGTDWTASAGDLLAYYHDGGTELHGKPIGVRIAGSDAVEGTCGSLADGQWCWGDSDTIGSNRLYVQLTAPATDPDLEATGHVKVLYGDGEYIELQHADFNSGNPVYVYVDTKVSDDAITLIAAPTGASADETNVTVFQAVNPWTDLRYNYSVSCTGAVCIEDITNGDQRPGLATTAIDETVGRGPIWAFVFKEGFDSDVAGAGGATITVTVNDDANGDTEDSQTIAVDEEPWAGSRKIYVDNSGTDADDDGGGANTCLNTTFDATFCTLAAPCKTPECGIEQLRRATAPAELIFTAGDTTTMVNSPTTWTNVSGDRRIRSSVAGTKATVTVPTTEVFFASAGTTSADVRIMDIDINKAGTAGPCDMRSSKTVLLRVDINASGASEALSIGGPTATTIDVVVWDSILTTNVTSSGVYPIYSPISDTATSAAESLRRAYMGNHLDFKGGEHVFRAWPYIMVAAYNEFEHDGTPSAPKDNLKLMCGSDPESFQSRYASFQNNYIYISGTSTENINAIDLDHDTAGNLGHVDYVFEGNYIENQNTGTTRVHVAFTGKSMQNILIKNNVFDNFAQNINASTPANNIAGNGVFIYNNSFWTDKATTIYMTKDGGGSSDRFSNLKVINNAASAAASTAGNIIQNNSTIGTIESTQILENIWDWGTVTSAWDIDTASGGFTGVGWPAQALKAAQLNYAASQGKDNNPLFALPASNDFRLCTASGVPDASCSGASPCIDAGWDLPTVYYDYSGAVRNSDDVGAWDDDSSGAGPPAAGDGANDMMLMGVAR